MSSRIDIKDDARDVVISIRSREASRFVPVVALLGMAAWIFFEDLSFSKAIITWGVPIAMVALYVIWEFFGEERIYLSDSKIRIEKVVGSIKYDEVQIDASLIDDVRLEEYSYPSKGGGRFTSRTVVFFSNTGVVAKSWQLSRIDGEALLSGPLKRFVRPDPS
jgi:hypothetical protein